MYLSSGRYPLRIRGDTLGEPVTFGLPRREKKLTLAYRCGEREGVIAENTTREEILWTPPLELAEAFPEKSRIPLTVVLTAPDGSRREERWELRLPADILPGGLRPGTRQAAAPGPGPGPVRRRDPEDPPALRRIPGRGREPDLRPAGTGRGHRFRPGLGQPGQIRPEGDHPFRPPLGAAQGRPGADPGEERAVSGPVVG